MCVVGGAFLLRVLLWPAWTIQLNVEEGWTYDQSHWFLSPPEVRGLVREADINWISTGGSALGALACTVFFWWLLGYRRTEPAP